MRSRPLLFAVVLAVAAPLAACGGDDGADTAPTTTQGIVAPTVIEPNPDGPVRLASPQEVAALLETDPPRMIIDVRTPEEFAEGHIDGATLMNVAGATFEADLDALPREATYVVYCRTGNRSATATAIMADLGFTDVVELDGGIVAWQEAGYPLV